MEDEISNDASDTKAEEAKERHDHYTAQLIHQEYEREADLRKEDIAEPDKVGEDMGGKDADDVVNEEALIDALASKTDISFKSPDRKKATKRGTARHEE